MKSRERYIYKVEYTDSIDSPHINKTEMGGPRPISKTEAEELLKEQLNANNIYPEWIRVIDIDRIA